MNGKGSKGTKEFKRKLCDINNENCILVEFTNENVYDTGFAAWISEDDQNSLQTIIDEDREIVIMWPACDVEPANKLKKKLAKMDFQQNAVKVLACGNWTDMRKQMKNMIDIGRLDVSKGSRKLIKKKKCDSPVTTKDLSKIKSKSLDVDKQKAKMLFAEIDSDKSEKDENVSLSDSDEEIPHKKKKPMKRFSMNLAKHDNTDSDSDTIKLYVTDSESENQRETADERPRLFTKQKSMNRSGSGSSLENNVAPLQQNSFAPYVRPSTAGSSTSNRASLQKKSCAPYVRPSAGTSTGDRASLQQNSCAQEAALRVQEAALRAQGPALRAEYPSDDEDVPPPAQVPVDIQIIKFDPWRDSHLPLEAAPRMPPLPLSKEIMRIMPKTSVEDYAAALATNVFTENELRSHSITGLPVNSFPNVPVRPGLPRRRLQYIYDTVMETFGRSVKIESKVRKGVGSKIKASRNKRRRNILQQVNH